MVYVFLADGFEEIEALTPVDIMRRANLNVATVGISGTSVTGSHGINVTADIDISEVELDKMEAIVLPGGLPGTTNLEKSEKLIDIISFCSDNNIVIAAICAAPSILGHMGLLKGKNAVSFPSFQSHLEGANVSEEYVVQDGNIITARGMGVSTDFSLKLVEVLVSEQESKKIRESIQCKI